MPAALPPAGTDERRFVIKDGGSATLRGVADDDITWTFTAIPDRPPTIALAKDPQAQARGSLQLVYKLEDDYGVVSAQATFTRKSPERAHGPAARALARWRANVSWIVVNARAFSFDNLPAERKLQGYTDRGLPPGLRDSTIRDAFSMLSICS